MSHFDMRPRPPIYYDGKSIDTKGIPVPFCSFCRLPVGDFLPANCSCPGVEVNPTDYADELLLRAIIESCKFWDDDEGIPSVPLHLLAEVQPWNDIATYLVGKGLLLPAIIPGQSCFFVIPACKATDVGERLTLACSLLARAHTENPYLHDEIERFLS